MATKSGKKTTSRGQTNRRKTSSRGTAHSRQYSDTDSEIFHEISLIITFAFAVILFLCNFGVIGSIGDGISSILFGVFGLLAYVAPAVVFFMIAFAFINSGNPVATRKLIAGGVLFFLVGILIEFAAGSVRGMTSFDFIKLFQDASTNRNGGGLIAGAIAYLLFHFLDLVGSILVVIVLAIICLVIVTEKSFVNGVKNGGKRVLSRSREEQERRKELAAIKREEYEKQRMEKEEQRRIRQEEKENEKILRMNKKVTGVMLDTSITESHVEDEGKRDDIHEIMLDPTAYEEAYAESYAEPYEAETPRKESSSDFDNIQINTMKQQEFTYQDGERELFYQDEEIQPAYQEEERKPEMLKPRPPKKYVFPPLSRLAKGTKGKNGDSAKELKDTAMRLQQTLSTFGVRVTITDISQGPSVTRYELQPEQGVKVSKIVGLTDDIKLNLAATDIRIEAPIPGKAAIGIEVPNKENTAVALRDLLESKEFKEFPSNLAFAVGKDIGGNVIVADIAKMPHMLIAGATGSGKSVCINTLIMSILYKAAPEDVKLIMIDPKVVELSVYNGIPHLLVPVVTDPKKAAAALHWGVAEMEDRYKKFADYNVRDLKGYNKKIEGTTDEAGEPIKKMPQIVIIVDELADLMMVAPGEVEESICRLAQLARAAGIHLIIATQRPSVDVITGLIKANMPSRVAFSVSSGVDSRTILDMNGAEKLLGKGDMLFYPQGYAKPARIQGAFVSDKEVSDVVDFLKNQSLGNVYEEDIEKKIQELKSSGSAGGISASDSGDDRDAYFADAGRFIIDKEKASIGMLQRVFKIGFNRAARIMDQLCEYGVVGEEEGTKPRKVLMSLEQFEQLLEEI